MVVYNDVSGPYRNIYLRELKYFITFMDDYSMITWTFLMKDRKFL